LAGPSAITISRRFGVAPAARAGFGEPAGLDGVAELARQRDQGRDQLGVAVAFDRLRGRGERHGLHAGQWVGHRDVEDRDAAEEDPLGAGLLAMLVALFDRDGGEDADRAFALAYAAVELQKGAEAGDVGRGDPAPVALEGDQPLVSEAVAGEAVGGAYTDPALPAVAAQQLAGGVLEALAVGAPARVLLGVG
jgi:hypothetical protein